LFGAAPCEELGINEENEKEDEDYDPPDAIKPCAHKPTSTSWFDPLYSSSGQKEDRQK
jgi:hypothetical protein